MKNLITTVCLICFLGSFLTLSAQDAPDASMQTDSKEYGLANDYKERQLNNVDTIPDYETKLNKLIITGSIFQSDGITPAKDVVLYIYHADDNGDYQTSNETNNDDVYHSGSIKTDADGKYTFYTFIPGSAIEPITYPRRRGPKKIFPVIKDQDNSEYELNALVFEDDPLLSKSCRRRIKKRGTNNILNPELKEGDIYVANKDIILEGSDQ